MFSRLTGLLRAFGPRDDSPAARVYWIVVAASLLLGAGLRVWQFAIDPPTLWLDEAYWAVKAITKDLLDYQIRPVGFMQATKWLLALFGPSHWAFRSIPFLASMVALALMPYCARRLVRSPWAASLVLFLFAVSPVALEMSSEFKHYGCEIAVHVTLLAAWLRYRDLQTPRSLALVMLVAWVGFLFSITIIFAYPALFLLLAWDSWQKKSLRRGLAVFGVGLVCLTTVLALYFAVWRGISQPKAEKKWGTWYDVFYLQDGLRNAYSTRVDWTVGKYVDTAALPGVGRSVWKARGISETVTRELGTVDRLTWAALHFAGLAYLLRQRRRAELFVLWSPIGFVLLFNLIGRWPAGAFRTNAFLVSYTVLLAGIGLDWLREKLARVGPESEAREQPSVPVGRRSMLVLGALTVLLVLPFLVFRPMWFEKGLWAMPGAFDEALIALHSGATRGAPAPKARPAKAGAKGSQKTTVVLDNDSCKAWRYYVPYDRSLPEDVATTLRKRFTSSCHRRVVRLNRDFERVLKSSGEVWIILSDPRKYEPVSAAAQRQCARVDQTVIRNDTHRVIHCVGNRKP
jgi:hypothetical protein